MIYFFQPSGKHFHARPLIDRMKEQNIPVGGLFCDNGNGKKSKIEKFKSYLGALKKTKRNDVVVAWMGHTGIMLWIFSKLTFCSRHIVSLNIMYNPHNVKQNIIMLLYRLAASDKKFAFTVNTPGLDEYYSTLLKCNKTKFPLVYDSVPNAEQALDYSVVKENYCFTGGGRST